MPKSNVNRGLLSGLASTTPRGTGLSPVQSSDPAYQSLYDANPYRNLTYHQSEWQKWLSKLGFRTDYDRWLEDAQVNAAEYDAQVASIMQQNDYNDPLSQASRMKAAGQNPDLLGTSGVSDSASPVQDVNGMSSNETNSFQQALPLIEGFFGAVTSSLSKGFVFAKDIVGFLRDLESRDLSMLSQLNSIADDYVRNRIGAADMSDSTSFEGRRNWLVNSLNEDKSYSKSAAKSIGVPRRWRRVFEKAVNDRAFSLASEVDLWNKAAERLKSRGSVGSMRTSKAYSEDDRVMDAYNKPISNARDQIAKIKVDVDKHEQNIRDRRLDVEGARLDLEEDYLDNAHQLDMGKHKAMSEDESYLQNYYHSRVEHIIKSTSAQIAENLQKEADRGSVLAKGCLLAWSLSDMLNFSFGDALNSVGSLFNPLGRLFR